MNFKSVADRIGMYRLSSVWVVGLNIYIGKTADAGESLEVSLTQGVCVMAQTRVPHNIGRGRENGKFYLTSIIH